MMDELTFPFTDKRGRTRVDVKLLACNVKSPPLGDDQPWLRVRCNRPDGHPGPHQKVRARTFVVACEWSAHTYSILPNGKPAKEHQ